ncbi:MAG: hypothetical protein HN348_19490, partial [Proteobacteria bacterium]|nr:hypothetical protein [Pseudomonadota bacterium]
HLDHFGVTRFVVHLRDPRQVTLSWTRYLEKIIGIAEPPDSTATIRRYWRHSLKHSPLRGGLVALARVLERTAHLGHPPAARYSDQILATSMYPFPKEYGHWDLSRRIDWQLEYFLPDVVSWMEAWLAIIDDPTSPFDILLTNYRQLHQAPDQLFRQIYAFYDLKDDPPPIVQPTVGQLHYRKGEIDEWKRVFSPEQIARAHQIIPTALLQRFNT